VQDKERREKEIDEKATPSKEEPNEGPDDDRGRQPESFQPHKLGITRKIGNFGLGWHVELAKEPTEMAKPKTISHGRMEIVGIVGMQMVMAMHCSPPERPVLEIEAAQDRQNELANATRFEGAMREVSVIPNRNDQSARCGNGENKAPFQRRSVCKKGSTRSDVNHHEGTDATR